MNVAASVLHHSATKTGLSLWQGTNMVASVLHYSATKTDLSLRQGKNVVASVLHGSATKTDLSLWQCILPLDDSGSPLASSWAHVLSLFSFNPLGLPLFACLSLSLPAFSLVDKE